MRAGDDYAGVDLIPRGCAHLMRLVRKGYHQSHHAIFVIHEIILI